jgi:hypothetical protein
MSNEFLNLSIKSHAEGIKLEKGEAKSTPEKRKRAESSDLYYDTLRGQYYSRADSSFAQKESAAFSILSGETDNTIDKIAKDINGNDGFIIDDKYNVKFDSSTYKESDVKYGINAVMRYPGKYLTKQQLTQGEKWDFRGGVTAQTDDKGYIIFRLTGDVSEEYQSKTGNPFIARIHISELPAKPKPTINEKGEPIKEKERLEKVSEFREVSGGEYLKTTLSKEL